MKRIFAVLFAAVLLCFCFIPASAETYPVYMETDEFNVHVTVGENNVLDITEEIKVDFLTTRHGIYRYIPYILEFDRTVGGERIQKRMRAAITDIEVEGEPYTVETEGSNELIIIGDEDQYVFGEKTYTISYKMKIYDDEISQADFFLLNLAPVDWEGDIEKFTAQVDFQKPLPEDAEMKFYVGEYGSIWAEGATAAMSQERDSLYVESLRPLGPRETVTLDITLPEGYFQNELTTDWAIPAALIAAALIAALAIALYFIFGRDEEVVPVINFKAPSGLTSAEIGYIIDGHTDQKDIISLIIYWAGKGYLEIHQDGKDFIFIKRMDLPRSAKRFESVMFDGLFKTGNEVSSKSLKNVFYETIQNATLEVEKYFHIIPENRIYTKASTAARIISLILCGLPLALVSLACLFDAGATVGTMIVVPIVIWFVSAIMCAFNIGVWDKKHTDTKANFVSKSIALGVATVVLALGAAIGVGAYCGAWVPLASAAAATLASIAFAVPTNKRTKQNTRLLGEILGFKQFIEHAELDRLKALVEEDPQYFYDVIPYAYVLGLSDKWAKKFESIAIEPPHWYYGYDYPFSSWIFWSSFNSSMNRCRADMVSVPAQTKVSGSGFGGGGFSGGGFGGGGGGSW